MDFTIEFDKHQIESIENILQEELIDLGVQSVILMDLTEGLMAASLKISST